MHPSPPTGPPRGRAQSLRLTPGYLHDLVVIPAGDRMGPDHRPVPDIELVTRSSKPFPPRPAAAREQYSVSHETPVDSGPSIRD